MRRSVDRLPLELINPPAPPPPVLAANDDNVTVEAGITTIVDVLANDSHSNAVLSLGTIPSGVVAAVSGNKLEVTLPYDSSGTTVTIPYSISESGVTRSANANLTVPNNALAKPMIFLGSVKSAAKMDTAVTNGWLHGFSDWTAWDLNASTAWLAKAQALGRKVHIPFTIWQSNGGQTAEDHMIFPSGGTPYAVGWTSLGQDSYDMLAANPSLHDTIDVITLEFESSNAQANGNADNEAYVLNSWEFFKTQMAAIGLDDRCYCYRTNQLPNSGLKPKWGRLYYVLEGDSGANVAFPFDKKQTALRNISAVSGVTGIDGVGAYVQGPVNARITPNTTWPAGLSKYVRPGYSDYLWQCYAAERAGCDWLTFWGAETGNTEWYSTESFTELKDAVADFLVDGIRDNTGYTDQNVPIGGF